jgi:hypothetical protein
MSVTRIIALAVLMIVASSLASSAQIMLMGAMSPPAASGNVPFTPLHTYYISTTGSDSNNGTSTSTAWISPNHNTACGDVVLVQAGAYAGTSGWGAWGTRSGCPSTSGGIDGTGGIYGTIYLCTGDLGSSSSGCTMNMANSGSIAMGPGADGTASDYGFVEGFTVTAGGANSRVYQVYACPSGDGGPNVVLHHWGFINDIAYNAGDGYDTNDCGSSGGQNTYGVDYWAVVGSIAQNAAQDPICLAAIDAVGPGQITSITYSGTHVYMYNNYSYANVNTSCRTVSDTESFMFDTWDAHDVTYQGVIANNIAYDSDRMCVQLFWQNKAADAATMKVYNNTCFQNNTHTGGDFADGEININAAGGSATLPWITTTTNNILYQPLAVSSGGGAVYAWVFGNVANSLTNGGSGTQNIDKANNTSCASTCNSGDDIVSFGSSSYLGTNTYANPSFTNTTDLLANQIGVPSCAGFTTTTACMGWNANTSSLTTPSVISDLQSTYSSSGKGFQLPSTTCTANADYPTWLKGVVYLHASGFVNSPIITENPDLVTKPCGM